MISDNFALILREHGVTIRESRNPANGSDTWEILYQDRVAGKMPVIGTIEVPDSTKIAGTFQVQTFEQILKLIDKYKTAQFFRTAEENSE